ncbi:MULTISPECIES: fimbrial protein [Serratia]|uniref:fimbrial protein n=1 Tax=Serratia TaxID=613 RepID=UPI0015F39A43|nr:MULTISPECIES: fimbrial protein [Serratia]MBE4976534.1 type 1 fimbrial protein [Serratia sp. X3]MCH6194802.1 type 1 fimbrial protein [Serratia sp. X10]UUW17371.1 type 1 fimbrial protein [Serratia ureilytica]
MWIKTMIFPLAVCLFTFTAVTAQAAGSVQGWGRVNMQGAIIDTACAIAVESRYQTVDMDVVPIADIIRDGQSQMKTFAIELVNCTLERANKNSPDWKQFQVTFDGDAEEGLFGVRGEASGIALQISDAAGNIATPGYPMPRGDIIPGNMRLNYALKLVANNHTPKAGDYFSAVRFKLDYF